MTETQQSAAMTSSARELTAFPSIRELAPGLLRWFLPFLFVIALVDYGLVLHDHRHQRQIRVADARHRIEQASSGIETTFRGIETDLLYLAGSNALVRMLDGVPGARKELAGEWLHFSRHKALYDQVRLLGLDGHERVRVNFRTGDPSSVVEADLQDKSDRYYFTDSLHIGRGSIFVSPLDLNMERGRIEVPFKPVIRFGTPVYDTQGRKRGIVLLNYLAQDLLDRFKSANSGTETSLYLLNGRGYWLSSPDPEDEWGFMFPERRGTVFGTRFPQAWNHILQSDAGFYENPGVEYVFDSVRPLPRRINRPENTGVTGGISGPRGDYSAYRWIVVSRYQAGGFLRIEHNATWLGLTVLALIVAAVAAWFIAAAGVRDRQILTHIEHKRVLLEEDVAGRTRELRQTNEQLALLLNSTSEAIFGVDPMGSCTFCNQVCLELLGYGDERQLLGRDIHALIHTGESDEQPGDLHACTLFSSMHGGRKTHHGEVMLRHVDGGRFPAEMRTHPIRQAGEILGAVVSFTDISERKQTQERIRTLSQAVEQSPVSVVITDPQARIQYVNRTFELVSGYSSEEVLGHNPSILKSGGTPPGTYREMWKMLAEGDTWHGEFNNRRKDGALYLERAHVAPVLDESGKLTHYLGVKEDITQIKQQEKRILQQAHYDFLTHLPNRFLAKDRLRQLINRVSREGQHVAVLFLDLDDFKRINDTLGHTTGDNLLVEAAERLLKAVRMQDTVARLGGDEFLVFMESVDASVDALAVAEHLLDAFRTPFVLEGHELVVTVSIGISLYPENGLDFNDLLRKADTAMYQSKKHGRNTYRYFTDSMNQQAARRLALDTRLRGALQRGDLYALYQPIVDIVSRKVVGAEVLARWRDEGLGEVSPVDFIPIAEQTGLIDVIGLYILAEATRQAVRFRTLSDAGFYIAVNVSPQQLRNSAFTDYVQTMLEDTELSGDCLVLEITEGVLMQRQSGVDGILLELHAMGVKIAMDDFGTGYSSLSYLRKYPFDILKIDRGFVGDLADDAGDRELVRSALQMAHALGLKVVAEGVEDDDQLEYLRQWDCDLGQGYLFGRPMSAQELENRLAQTDPLVA